MRIFVTFVLASIVMLGVALAQDDFPAVMVAEMVKDSVVAIDANTVTYGAVTGAGTFEYARYQELLTNRLTGFVYSDNGYIITDSRDIEGATILTVIFGAGTENERELDAEIVGIDEEYGIGVIKVEPEEPLIPVKLMADLYDPTNDQYPYEQGDAVVTIGYSGGFGGTVTYGIISAIRNFRNRNGILLPHVIQADTAINAGNEGCPLFNDRGDVIAMHDRRGGGGSMQNTTFFIPVWLVKRVADEIIANYESAKPVKDFEVWHPWLGIKPFSGSRSPFGGIREFSDDLKMYMDIPDQYWDVGILMDKVWYESPAREFGLRDRDIVLDITVLDVNEDVKIDYQLIKSIGQVEILVTTADRGDIFVFGVLRNYNYFKVSVPVGQHPGLATAGFEMTSEYF
jgi:S1-C subfamily serine protease